MDITISIICPGVGVDICIGHPHLRHSTCRHDELYSFQA